MAELGRAFGSGPEDAQAPEDRHEVRHWPPQPAPPRPRAPALPLAWPVAGHLALWCWPCGRRPSLALWQEMAYRSMSLTLMPVDCGPLLRRARGAEGKAAGRAARRYAWCTVWRASTRSCSARRLTTALASTRRGTGRACSGPPPPR